MENQTNDSFKNAENISNDVQFIFIIIFQILSMLAHIFIIYHLITNRTLRESLHNHPLLLLLITNFTFISIDLSMTMHFLRRGFLDPNQKHFCIIWNFLDSFLPHLSTILMMWASFERHILIFYHRQLLDTKYKRFLFHYLPLIIATTYSFMFHLLSTLLNSACLNLDYFAYNELFCGTPCSMNRDSILLSFNYGFNRILSAVLIFVFSLILLIRILWGRYKRNQIIRWSQHRKMAFQFLTISILYFIGSIPTSIHELILVWDNSGDDLNTSALEDRIFHYLFYFVSLILPLVYLLSVSELYSKLPFFNYLKNRLCIHVTAARNRVGIAQVTVPANTTK